MKQHITEEQILEISNNDIAFCKLKEWVGQKSIPLLSIGDMISLIEQRGNINSIENRAGDWYIKDTESTYYTRNTDLCDALWESVKFLLKMKDETRLSIYQKS